MEIKAGAMEDEEDTVPSLFYFVLASANNVVLWKQNTSVLGVMLNPVASIVSELTKRQQNVMDKETEQLTNPFLSSQYSTY